MGSRTAISAGVLVMTLAAIPLTAPAATAADCPSGGGLLGGVTDGLCDVVGVVTGTVDTLTGDTLKPVTKGLNDTTGKVLGTVGEVAPTTAPSREHTPEPSQRGTLLPETLGEVCLPVLACDGQADEAEAPKATPKESEPAPEPTESADERAREQDRDDAAAPTPAPTTGPTPPQSEPYLMDTSLPEREDPVADEPTVDTDDARIDLLWPHPFARELSEPLRQRVVRPSSPASDVAGTGLTIALLLSAIAATRIVQQRRQRGARPASIPFEPAHTAGGRHRLA
ncbi:hypothetical protein [Nonomuraea cavernae]|uniref:Uncharacterized protein n=1 Tax=Nonomuraea cavernae TaxID=2045107 RepID=A0A917Z944_9ACTN|nr:hypothetical protein [Nonomuraea cavernae]MCA2189157.1 hypothetical protein [Nonomuraea cavernae]GGO76338.1 hypothetical protein GCM10012289_53470 [Nonomuraea cavernae]